MKDIQIKRIYERAEKKDGRRVLIDRLWPRGISKEEAKLDVWLKEIGPSNDLRKWFNHEAEKFPEFKRKYKQELQYHPPQREALDKLQQITREKRTTLLTATREPIYNHAQILYEILMKGV